ncbi:hypothetical protein TBLA_0H01510 [Henningerozyma blattae CBS 6284]|uniref:DNA repair protein RAD16 n=1 Tax=Henningerozyma blattae (strain ATCC 34711 / CBS 6284 / DSM 70876 / NBRC 10599 / NRRL Y-10934 / UCD 77-7) TaxID=1071380 RepID=I2H7T6_HENB6|nr:hypothetical protein TBLA_0H01510 [Tetrapisispora blattae CBS 6284]CCH62438.1 hypothetical protein TBLA_0H01510 [Tetrapisispora blattae CBS 6284]
MEEGGFIRKRTRSATAKKRRSAGKVNYKEVSDDDDIQEIKSEDDEDEDFVVTEAKRRKASSSKDNLIDLTDDTEQINIENSGDENHEEESDVEDKPLAKNRRKATTKKNKAKPKKPKTTPYERNTLRLFENHPYLKDVFPTLQNSTEYVPKRALQPKHMTIKLLPFQLEGLHWLINQEENSPYNGGVLADEMGMGKTIQTIALLMNDLNDYDPSQPGKKVERQNLVVAPTVALMQWKNEIDQHTNGMLTTYVYHGGNRTSDMHSLKDYNVILTTYAVLESVYRKQTYGFRRKTGLVKENSVLHHLPFHRVILDEAHNIKDRTSNTAKAVNSLITKKRWCLSGTPLQNRIGEMYSLIRFLDIVPFSMYFCTKCDCASKDWKFTDRMHCDNCNHVVMQHTNFFNHFMLKNILKFGIEGSGLDSFNNIQVLLKNIMLRRTKVERADDLGLPPRIVTIRKDYFNDEEKDLYRSLYSDIKRKFNSYVEQGVVLNNYANIFTLITRMRQMADHPDLVLKKLKSELNNKNSGIYVCQLCNDEAEEPIESKCHHQFCRLCIKEYVESSFLGESEKLSCPVCHIGLSIDLSQPSLEVDPEVFSKKSIINRLDLSGKWKSSTKIEALVEELYNLRSDKRTIKSIVFSQFTSMLDLVEWRLKRAGFETVKLQGSMSPTQRDETIKYFMNNIHCEVFLVSLKAGGVALNLCEASQVFILDPWWNPSVEWQSGDRVHRIGQYRPVKITRFCIEDSIESRIIELQEKKANMINATINQDSAAINRLTPADLQFLFNN